MADRCYLAVDLGAESGRVVAGLFDGQRVRLEELHRFSNGAVQIGGTLRWDVLRLWADIQNGLSAAAAKFGSAIASIGVDTWGVDYVLMTKTNEMLGAPWHYRDARSQGMLNHALTKVPRGDIFAATGLQFMEINTLYQLLAMRQTNPDLMRMADVFLMMPDYLHWALCGSRVVEFTNATTTQCFDATQGTWAFDLLKKLEIPTHFFPEVVPPGTKLGNLRDEISRRTNLARIPVIAPATHDTGSAVAAVPTEKTGSASWAYISSGTWSLMGVEVQKAVLTPRALQLNVTNEGGIDGTYRLLKNIMGLWLVQECRRSFERHGKPLDYAPLIQLATAAAPFQSLIDPDDPQFLSPDDMPAAIQNFCQETNQPVPTTEGQLIRCCLESLALKYRVVMGWMEELTGTPIEVIHIVGGGTKNELLNQFTANACGRPVVTGPVEATALGNVLVQARTSGEIGSLSEIRDIVRRSSEMRHYAPQNSSDWQAANSRFAELRSRPKS